jgi:uncharacterized repeat protein (TIGR03803 family)
MKRYTPFLILLFAVVCMSYHSVHAQGVYTVIHRFAGAPEDGRESYGSLILHEGKLYGMAAGGGTYYIPGIIYSVNPDGTDYTVLHNFAGQPEDGAWPHERLCVLGDKLYGMTFAGGCEENACPNFEENGCGTAFSIATGGTDYSVLWTFACGGGDGDASLPESAFVSDGEKLYATTPSGGTNGCGTVFSLNADGTDFTILHSFDGTDGNMSSSNLLYISGAGGDILYGTTTKGGANDAGTAFSIITDGSDFTTLHEFEYATDGALPGGTMTLYNNRIYGTAIYGGEYERGTIYSMQPDGGDFKVIHHFDDAEGAYPYEGVTVVEDKLYGVTTWGGTDDSGVIYSLEPDGSNYTVLYNLEQTEGGWSDSKLVYDNGYLYGTTSHGGSNGNGVIFSFDLQNRPTPTPTPTPVPSNLTITVSSENPNPGDILTIDVELTSVAGAFDAYGGIILPGGKFHSFRLRGGLQKGIHPLISNVKGLRKTYSRRLFTGRVPSASRTYRIIAGLMPEGVNPSVARAIPGYLDRKTVTVE